jgi:hypothetical protein
MSRVPYHLGRTDPVDTVDVGAGGSSPVIGAGAEVAGAVLVAEEPEPGKVRTSRMLGWQKEPNNCRNKVDQVQAERMGRQRHGSLRSAPLGHGDPGG